MGSLAAATRGISPRVTATGLLSPFSSSSESKQITSTFSLGVLIILPLFIIPLVEGVASGTGGMGTCSPGICGNGLLPCWVDLS